MSKKPKEPLPADVFCGKQIRAFRHYKGVSQVELGQAIGIKFQQVQKYETGTNRVSASRLKEIADFFETSILDFFEPSNTLPIDQTVPKGTAQLIKNFAKLAPQKRKALLNISAST